VRLEPALTTAAAAVTGRKPPDWSWVDVRRLTRVAALRSPGTGEWIRWRWILRRNLPALVCGHTDCCQNVGSRVGSEEVEREAFVLGGVGSCDFVGYRAGSVGDGNGLNPVPEMGEPPLPLSSEETRTAWPSVLANAAES